MRSRELVISLVTATLVAAGAAPAAATWGPVADLSPAGKNALNVRVAASANGDAVVAWTLGSSGTGVFQAARKPLGKRWSAPATLSRKGAVEPDVAMDAKGNGCAVWSRRAGGKQTIEASCFKRGGGWSKARTISRTGTQGSGPQVAMRDGVAAFVWTRTDSSPSRVQLVRHTGKGWGSVTTLSAAGSPASGPVVSLAGSGRATVAWAQGAPGAEVIRVRREARVGRWLTARTVSPGGQRAFFPRLAMVKDGTAMVIWRAAIGSNQEVWCSHRVGESGLWEPSQAVSPSGAQATSPEVAANRTDDVFAVVWVLSGSPDIVQEARRNHDGAWTLVHQVSSPGADPVFAPDVAVDDQQTATVVWQEHDGMQYRVAQARQNLLFSWEPTTYLDVPSASGSYEPQVARTTHPIFFAWSRYDADAHLRVQAQRYDPTT